MGPKEKWDADSALSPDEQMRQIFARFLALPLPERQVRYLGYCTPPPRRWVDSLFVECGSNQTYANEAPPQVYTQQVMDRRVFWSGSLSQAEQDILALARPYEERNLGEFRLLRTYYGPGSDDAFEAVVKICEVYGGIRPECVFSDAARYGYGEDWQRLFGRMPQLLECDDGYEEERAAKFAEAQEKEGEDGCEYDGSLGELSLGDLFNRYHLASQVGVLYVLDEETLGEDEDGSEVSHDDREILVVWYDAYGKTVRWRRGRADNISNEMALINTASIDDHPVWTEAEIGEDYDWDGPLGPRSTEEGEESDSDGESDNDGDP